MVAGRERGVSVILVKTLVFTGLATLQTGMLKESREGQRNSWENIPAASSLRIWTMLRIFLKKI